MDASEGRIRSIPPVVSGKKQKVAAYCRVSTLFDSQESSIEAQREHYERLIGERDDWELAGIYLEVGMSGTKAQDRQELNRLLKDCRDGKVDLILTKSISRFARNTTDCLEMVRMLNNMGVNLYFEKENIHTGTMESEFMLSILACLAEDESRSVSGNVKWGIRKRFENGTFRYSRMPYGYEKRDGQMSVVEEEASVVREIYAMILSGQGADTIAASLNERGIPWHGERGWLPSTIRSIVSNPVYVGDMLYQKTYVDENFCHRKNTGEKDRFYIREHHEAIIDRDTFELAAQAVRQRAKECGTYRFEENRIQAERRKQRYIFSGVLTCAHCGRVMYRQMSKKGRVSWICQTHRYDAVLCPMKPVADENVQNAFINVLNKLAWSQSRIDPDQRVLDVYVRAYRQKKARYHENEVSVLEDHIQALQAELAYLEEKLPLRGQMWAEQLERRMNLESELREMEKERGKLLKDEYFEGRMRKLYGYIGQWKITDCPDIRWKEIFTACIRGCSVDSGKSVTFEFYCGLRLTESL